MLALKQTPTIQAYFVNLTALVTYKVSWNNMESDPVQHCLFNNRLPYRGKLWREKTLVIRYNFATFYLLIACGIQK